MLQSLSLLAASSLARSSSSSAAKSYMVGSATLCIIDES